MRSRTRPSVDRTQRMKLSRELRGKGISWGTFFAQWVKKYKRDPVAFMREVLLYEPDPWQKEVAMAFVHNKWVTVRSGQGVGKTALQAALLLWFLMTNPYPRIVCTAPTYAQLRDVLWAEISKWIENSEVLKNMLKWTKTYIYLKGMEKRWFALARVAVRPENMQGFHEDNMLFLVDEASGVRDDVMEAILGNLTGPNNKLGMFGNPTRPNGIFYDSHHGARGDFKAFRVNAEDSPRTSKENIAALARAYGKDSNVYRVRVLGQFPTSEDDAFISLSLIEASIMTEPPKKKKGEQPLSIHIGCDVARYGDDKTVIAYKIDEVLTLHKKRRGQNLMKTADDIIELAVQLRREYKWEGKIPVKIDDGGLGGGVTDRLMQLKQLNPDKYDWIVVFPVNFGQRINHKHYYDSTSFMMGIVKKLLSPHDEDGKPKTVELILPNDTDLVGQLSSRKYGLTDKGLIMVESKKAMKKRGLPSPDEADCVLLCCLPVTIKGERRKT